MGFEDIWYLRREKQRGIHWKTNCLMLMPQSGEKEYSSWKKTHEILCDQWCFMGFPIYYNQFETSPFFKKNWWLKMHGSYILWRCLGCLACLISLLKFTQNLSKSPQLYRCEKPHLIRSACGVHNCVENTLSNWEVFGKLGMRPRRR